MKEITVKWGDIIAQCGNYRDGFVAIFRQYEGMPTDEKDTRGRAVKVTVPSFAEHVGIPERTFRRWAKSATQAGQPRSTSELGHDVRRAATAAPDAVVAGIMAASEEAQQAILDKLERQVTSRHIERMPFGGEKPKVPGEDYPTSTAVEIRSLCATILGTLGVLEVKLAEADVDEIEDVAPSLATVAHRAAEVLDPFVPSADSVEQWLRERSEP